MGAQMGYRTVFFLEYFGPLVTFPIIYLLRKQIYGEEKELHEVQL